MDSKKQLKSDSKSVKKSDGSSVVDRKTMSKTGGLSTPTESKRHCPVSRTHKLVIDAETDASTKSVGQGSASSASTKRHGKGVVSDERQVDLMFFADIEQGPHQAELRFRLIHFWEARNPRTKVLIGEEMLLIDEKGTPIQGFIPAGRVDAHLPMLRAGCVYSLKNFFGAASKENFRVADHGFTVSFSWNSVLTLLKDEPVPFPEDNFRFHSHAEFDAKADKKGDLYDFLGHMKLVEGQSLSDCARLDEAEIAEKRRVLVHVQAYDGPLVKMYLWDKAASDFWQRFKANGSTLGVILVTTLNPKRLGDTLALTTMASSRVFMDTDVHPTREYIGWLSANLEIANMINANVVTKPEIVTLRELFTYIKQENAKVAWFECTATIDDILRGSAWYYISCGGCHSKATKGANSLICTNEKCKKTEVTGVPEYMVKVSVYDKSEQSVFVILGSAGRDLIGKHASELVANYFENNESVGADELAPVPQALMETIGQTRRFIVKVSTYNLTGKSQTITVTKVLPLEQPQLPIEDASGEEVG